MLKKLRVKFVCINMLIVMAMLCAMFGMLFSVTKSNLESESIQMMADIANDPFHMGRPDERPDGVRLPYFTLQIGLRGTLIATGGGYYDLSNEAFLKEVMTEALEQQTQTGILEGYNLRFYRTMTPTSQLLVFADTTSEQATLMGMARTFAIIGTLSFLVFLGVSLLLARWAVKPVDRAWKQQKQFVADASHELKTPLTVIMTNAELLQSPEVEVGDRDQLAGNILTMSRQMRGLVEGLLELARMDNGSVKTAHTDLDWSMVVEDALLPFEPLYFEKGLELESHLDSGLRIRGSESHLRQVVEILLDNAMKYACPESKVWVYLLRQGKDCLLSVANPCPEISKADLKNIFKRFYRVDQARTTSGSYGLGLSIAEGIVKAHKGKIWAESANGINVFHVQLPLQ